MSKEIKFAIKSILVVPVILLLSIPLSLLLYDKIVGLIVAWVILSTPMVFVLDFLPSSLTPLFLLIPFCNTFIVSYVGAKLFYWVKRKSLDS